MLRAHIHQKICHREQISLIVIVTISDYHSKVFPVSVVIIPICLELCESCVSNLRAEIYTAFCLLIVKVKISGEMLGQ